MNNAYYLQRDKLKYQNFCSFQAVGIRTYMLYGRSLFLIYETLHSARHACGQFTILVFHQYPKEFNR